VIQILEVLKKSLSSPAAAMLDAGNATLSSDVATVEPVPDVSPRIQFESLQYALFSTNFVEVIGGLFFLLTAIYIIRDKRAATGKLARHIL
jgi:MFS transporter, Spinster family, sphingosine-1-phosphate transporter